MFSRKHVGPKASIHVYEKSSKVGGRLAIEEFNGHWYEAGGSIIHSSNKYMVDFIKQLGMYIFLRYCKKPSLNCGQF